ncbi:hydroxylysine kinase /5-phosphonooxy-L-lysine phospho-lyase apoenzyme [Cribrihabitans marinus]|uniref:Hydroxylysine kinase /5-phosphonooxy-L-lysine phospho-lyase apoenzyme n=1 Tax=Cribrihabitans marinus TaxID=1227549 RepID=A0A1H7BLZ6_9RHOB|nr:aminotransferase class III-fold pyridoxal phosphate-dependent enzyme [Cribrihabitans marinus]GGH34203.1 peptidase M23 [Cribrihabitans marinus]SEJ78609.1 hydroxylysine kinase /5-phosphonooxy-L-lysine phospho-lyase apoenzyme [Cribrihabitans marinus]
MPTESWVRHLRQHWGMKATLARLNGEYDLNFAVTAQDGREFVLKVMRPGCDRGLVEMQVAALAHLARRAPGLPFPAVIQALDGAALLEWPDPDGQSRLVWLQERLPGRCYAESAPKSLDLIRRLGRTLGAADRALEDFRHPSLERDFKWDLTRAEWIEAELNVIADPDRRAWLTEIVEGFRGIRAALSALPRQAIHNDANDYNILVEGVLSEPRRISGLIDLGDICAAPKVCELAIAGAYVVLNHPHPERALAALVQGYHAANRLTADEVDLIWPLLRMRLVVSVVNSALMATEAPDDPYVTISQAPAWRFLENEAVNGALMPARLRAACRLPVAEGADRVMAWLERQRGSFAPILGESLEDTPVGSLSVEGSVWPRDPFNLAPDEAARVGEEHAGNRLWLGRYNEPRLIYTAPAFRKGPWKASDRRSVHIAADVFAPAGTPIHAPLAGTVAHVENRAAHLDYGGVVILRHETPEGDAFHTLHGHLDPEVCDRLRVGDPVEQGAAFARLGSPGQNGGWAPHLHLQLALSVAGMEADWPGVADPDELELWHALCPNPAALLNLPDDRLHHRPTDRSRVLEQRLDHFAPNLSLSYDAPVMLVRGWRHHLFDEWGRPYLDAYNNVPHVGHAHPRIQAVAADQLRRVNTNTRYLHPAQVGFAEKILSKLPDHLQVCFFVNSGTEANELALRLARAHTGARGMVTPDHGYHGNTTGAVDISAYKFNKPGGPGQPVWVELVELADDYRGSFRRDDPDRAAKFAALVEPAIARLMDKGHGLAGFIAETFPSVGGQIIPPPGYLPAVYARVRAAGGVCIADEVQTGLGRLGDHYFGFEQQGASPDIVVLGKPIGNGHPLGVLVTTREIAASFAQGPEFFSTFGGSTLSCRIGKEVLDIVDDEGLQENARVMGERLIAGLRQIEADFACIGDVRGMGLFLGVELVHPDGSEATEICAYVKNRMRDHRILIGSEGPKDNILKIRPPLTIEAEDVDMILSCLRAVLGELGHMTPDARHRHHHHGPGCGCT